MTEAWKPVPGYEGRYEVSDLGRVRSITRSWFQPSSRGRPYWYTKQGRVLRPGPTSDGYPSVVLGRGNTRLVHQLVAEAFIGPRPAGQEVRHKNGKRTDPRSCNLEYGTRSENIRDAIRHGTWSRPRKLTDVDVRNIREMRAKGVLQKHLAKTFGVSTSCISLVVTGRRRACAS